MQNDDQTHDKRALSDGPDQDAPAPAISDTPAHAPSQGAHPGGEGVHAPTPGGSSIMGSEPREFLPKSAPAKKNPKPPRPKAARAAAGDAPPAAAPEVAASPAAGAETPHGEPVLRESAPLVQLTVWKNTPNRRLVLAKVNARDEREAARKVLTRRTGCLRPGMKLRARLESDPTWHEQIWREIP